MCHTVYACNVNNVYMCKCGLDYTGHSARGSNRSHSWQKWKWFLADLLYKMWY